MAGASPTQLTLKNLRERGYRAAVVEKWNHHVKIRQDLFGIIDVIGVGKEGTIGVQSTTGGNVQARIKKIADSDAIGDIREAGWIIEVHGWIKINNRWRLNKIDIS